MPLSTEHYGYIVDPFFSFMDEKGKAIKNGFLRVFLAGSSTPAVTYLNWNGSMNQETIQLDNSGRCYTRVIGAKDTLYKVVVYNILHSQENPLLTVDNVQVLSAIQGVLDNSITTNKLVDESVTTAKIHESAVTTLKIANNAVTTEKINDGAITEDKLAESLKKLVMNNFVTPEQFGAVGDGVADDTAAVQAALDSGKNVFGVGTYRVGQKNVSYQEILFVNNPCQVKLNLIDNRTYGSGYNQDRKGVIAVNSDYVDMYLNVISENTLPISSDDNNNQRDVGGYAVSFLGNRKYCSLYLVCDHIKGVISWESVIKNCEVKVFATNSSYPWHVYVCDECNVEIDVDKCHRGWWGCAQNSSVKIRSKNFYSNGSSSHHLFHCLKLNDNVNYGFVNTTVEITDTGSVDVVAGVSEVAIENQITGETFNISGNIHLMGDLSVGTNSAFTVTQLNPMTGDLHIVNDLVTSSSRQLSRWNNGVNLSLQESVENSVQITTAENIRANLKGCSTGRGAVILATIGTNCRINIRDYFRVTTSKSTETPTDAYQSVVISNVYQFDPAEIQRCTYTPVTTYNSGTPTV